MEVQADFFASLYATFARHGPQPILRPEKIRFDAPAPVISDEKYLDLIDWVWDRYGQYTAMTLFDMTHAPGTPWRRVAERYDFRVPKHFELPDEDVKTYFKAEALELA